jgi:3-methyl-2-oxobutanoate hydroxymethyltransferase
VARAITENLKIPVIGIGAGPDCDGQVLVYHDLVGAFTKFKPRFVKKYADIDKSMRSAVRRFVRDVRAKHFPNQAHSFSMKQSELLDFERIIGVKRAYGR